MKYSEQQLEKVKRIELNILEEIIRVCEKNNLDYFTVAGTTLGAVRHNGFIPWDDDIDIGMMRDDYEKFIEISPTELSEGYTITHFKYDRSIPTYFAKVRKDGTRFVEKYAKDINMHHGVFVDIFPYDYVPESEIERKKYCRRVKLWNQLFIAKSVSGLTFHRKKNILLMKTIRVFLHLMMKPVSKEYLFNKTDLTMRSYNDDNDAKQVVCSRGLDEFINNYTDIFPTKDHTFESIKVAIPAKYDKVLRQQYGEYMELPPESERYNHTPEILEL